MALALNMTSLFLVAGGIITVSHNHSGGIHLHGHILFRGSTQLHHPIQLLAPVAGSVPRQQIPSAFRMGLPAVFQVGIISGPRPSPVLFYGGYGPKVAWLLPLSLMTISSTLALMIGHKHRNFRSEHKRETDTDQL